MTVKISNLPAATSVGSGDVLPVVQSGTTKKIDLNSPWNINIDGGNIDGTPIGVSSASSGAFTTLTASGDVNFDSGTLFVDVSTDRVGIGTTAPSSLLTVASNHSMELTGNNLIFKRDGLCYIDASQTNGILNLRARGVSGQLIFQTNDTERMRIDSSGNVLIGTTTASGTGVTIYPSAYYDSVKTGTSSATHINFQNGNGTVGSITTNGLVTAYNISSDYRLKENAQPIIGALAKVQALNPVRYNWRADGSEGEGFIAHELQEVVPYAVSGEKDGEDMQGVDYGKLTTLLTAAIKELKAELDELKGA